MDKPLNVGLGHYSGVGKDVLAAQIVEHCGHYRRAFADAVKEEVGALLLNVVLNDGNRYSCWRFVEDRKHTPAMRSLLQAYGDGKRELVNKNYWINQLSGYMEVFREGELAIGAQNHLGVVIPDCRYPNEVEWLIKVGGLAIDLFRPDAPSLPEHQARHISETALWPWDFPFLLYNDAHPMQMLSLFHKIRERFEKEGNPPLEQWPHQYRIIDGLVHIDTAGMRDR